MDVLRTRNDITQWSRRMRAAGETIVLVPTMGALHEGHLSLVDQARTHGTKTVVSIFVNPKQFNVTADLERYPRDEARDLALLAERGVDLVFAPDESVIYPERFSSHVSVRALTECYEGAGRPGHFAGVTTVVTILFNLVAPHAAVFGEKDFQQLRVIEQMVGDLGVDIEILRAPLVREEDGLAMSSRNVRLSSEGRIQALVLGRSLRRAAEERRNQSRQSEDIILAAMSELNPLIESKQITLEYLVVVDEETLEPILDIAPEHPARILVAAMVEGVRLLDNMPL